MQKQPFSTNIISQTVAQFFVYIRHPKTIRNIVLLLILAAYPFYFLYAYIAIINTPFPPDLRKEFYAAVNNSTGFSSQWHTVFVQKVPFIFPVRVYSDEGNTIDEVWCITVSPPVGGYHESEFVWFHIASDGWQLLALPCIRNGRMPDAGG